MTDRETFAKYRKQMLSILSHVASEFGVAVEEADGEEFGFQFAIDNGDDIALVTLTITQSTQGGGAGNLIFRATSEGNDNLVNWGPDNYTEECWANYNDDDAWLSKLRVTSAYADTVTNVLHEWKAEPHPSL